MGVRTIRGWCTRVPIPAWPRPLMDHNKRRAPPFWACILTTLWRTRFAARRADLPRRQLYSSAEL